jgi:hypothetical protein
MAVSTPLPQNTNPPTPFPCPSPPSSPMDSTSLLPFTCTACGS